MAEKLYYSMGEVTEMFDVEASLIRYWCSQFTCLRPKRNAKGNRLFSPQDVERLKRIHHLLKEKKMTIEGAKKAMRKRNIEAEQNDSDITLLEQLQSLRAMLVDMRNNMGEPLPEESIIEEQPIEQPIEQVVENEPVEQVLEPVVEQPVEEVAQSVEEVVAEEVVDVAVVAEEAPAEAEEVTIEDIFETKTETKTEEVAASVVEAVAEEVLEPVAEPEPEVVAEVAEAEVAETTEVAAVSEEIEVGAPVKRVAPKKKRAPRRKLIGEEGVVERPLFPFYEQTLF